MSNPAFEALVELAALSRRSAAGLPGKTSAVPRWSGISFSLLGCKFAVPMGQVSEIMEVPVSTRLPGVQPWVMGLSNVRGRLLPLFDLGTYFGGSLSAQKKRHRALVIENSSLYSGLVIDESFGMQHFEVTSFEEIGAIELPDSMHAFVRGSYRDANGEPWNILDLSVLAEDNRFLNAALVYALGS